MIRASIVGGTGYTGVELLRILALHPTVEIFAVTSRVDAGRPISDVYPNLWPYFDKPFVEPTLDRLLGSDVVFFATPNGTAMRSARELLDRGIKVIDLAADFRLKDSDVWAKWYGEPHQCPDLLSQAVYGLPELNREKIIGASLVACPGCYPTSVQLGLAPLLEKGLINPKKIITDVKSGVSGAGRKAELPVLMAETGESFKAYSVDSHRHWPEIKQALDQISADPVGLTFVPHLVPMIRGIHSTIYAELNTGEVDLQAIYESRYRAEPFIDVLSAGMHPDTRNVKGSNRCQIAVHRPMGGNVVVILSVIDNLVKGAAGQAVQNMNLMFGLSEEIGIPSLGLYP